MLHYWILIVCYNFRESFITVENLVVLFQMSSFRLCELPYLICLPDVDNICLDQPYELNQTNISCQSLIKITFINITDYNI